MMTTATVSARRFARITVQLLRALIMAGVTAVLGYLLIHPHAQSIAPHPPTSQPPTASVIEPRQPAYGE